MVDENKKQDRQQEQATRQTRIKAAVADFLAHGLKQVQAKRATRQAQPAGGLFGDAAPDTGAQGHE